MLPQESLRTRLSSGLQSLLVALHLATPHADVHYVLESDSGSKSGLELGAVTERKAQTRIVHASIIDKDEIDICKSASGEDWLLGMGSYGMVRHDACNYQIRSTQSAVITLMSMPACLNPFALKRLPLPACLPQPACFCQLLPVRAYLPLPALASQPLPACCRVPIPRPLPLLLPLPHPLLGPTPTETPTPGPTPTPI